MGTGRRRWDAGMIQGLLSDLSYIAAIEKLGRRLIKEVLWRASVNGTQIALTFDDGPHRVFTPRILELLTHHDLRATFFVVGRSAAVEKSLVGEMVAQGHEIANHSYTHPLLIGRSETFIAGELQKTDQLLRELGCKPCFFRPPMGLFTKSVIRIAGRLGYRTVVGDVYPRDPHRPGAKKIADRILNRVRRGSIIILHDGGNSEPVDRSQTIEALQFLIPILKNRGFRFVTLPQLVDSNQSYTGENQ